MVLLHLYKQDYSQEMSKIHKKSRVIGDFEIRKVIVPKGNEQQHWMKSLGMCRSVFHTVQLRQGETLWMSDVPMEQETNNRALDEARGNVLECGLGIGMFTHLASKKDEVESITVVEKYSDVIKLVYPKIKTPKTNYVNMDMLDYLITTKERYDMIHVDIWAGADKIPVPTQSEDFILSSQVYTNARDLARFGQFYLQRGVWNGERLLSEEWIDFVRTPAPATADRGQEYGGQWWLVPEGRDDVPTDAYSTSGNRGQYTVVVPSHNVVIVRRGLDYGRQGFDRWSLTREVLKAIDK